MEGGGGGGGSFDDDDRTQTGTLATFNWDFVTSATAVAAAQTHLSR